MIKLLKFLVLCNTELYICYHYYKTPISSAVAACGSNGKNENIVLTVNIFWCNSINHSDWWLMRVVTKFCITTNYYTAAIPHKRNPVFCIFCVPDFCHHCCQENQSAILIFYVPAFVLFFPSLLPCWGAGIAQWLERKTCDKRLWVRIPAGTSGEFSSPGSTFCALILVSVPPPCYHSST